MRGSAELFPPHRQRQARASLTTSLRGIVSQRLLPRSGGRGRVPAVEILVANTRVRERIADPQRLSELDDEMVHGDLYGMQTFDQSLVHLYRNGLVARDDAIAHANAASEMRFSCDRADLERTQETPSPPPPPAAPHVPAPPLTPRAAVV